jgi:hemerythrin-like metal-binding protein
MPFIVWNDRLSVGIDTIDHDHRMLVSILNDLYGSVKTGREREDLVEILDRLVEYTKYHFEKEEDLFARVRYAEATAHKHEHDNMVAWVAEARDRLKSGSSTGMSLETVVYLKDWMFDHIITSDQAYVPQLNVFRAES